MRLSFFYRWDIAIIGDESGTETRLTFARFRRLDAALALVRELNSRAHEYPTLTHFEVRRIGSDEPPVSRR